VPDLGYWRELPDAVYVDTAAIVVDILSPDDETYEKLPFYAAHGVTEVFIVDPDTRRAHMFVLQGEHYAESDRSDVLACDSHMLETSISWP
jgi:Uma2 family endonuclease